MMTWCGRIKVFRKLAKLHLNIFQAKKKNIYIYNQSKTIANTEYISTIQVDNETKIKLIKKTAKNNNIKQGSTLKNL